MPIEIQGREEDRALIALSPQHKVFRANDQRTRKRGNSLLSSHTQMWRQGRFKWSLMVLRSMAHQK